ncbi:MAG: SPOR domain-containing protein [Gammaproteobacteria bacterium]|nr:SPOR domain-containing protein [Gammaproteobacteria bacterium]
MSVAAKNNFQNYDPRHRLTGAVVLILLAIVLLPMLLSKKPDTEVPAEDHVVMEITNQGKKVFVSRISSITPTDSAVVQHKARGAEAKGSGTKNNSKKSSARLKPTAKPVVSPVVPPKRTVKAPAKKSAATQSEPRRSTTKKSSKNVPVGGWILQVGVFSQSANANKKVSTLKKKGFAAKSVKVKTSRGTVTKVWIGPFKNRESAEKMQDRLQHKIRQRGIIVKNKS